MGNGSLLRDFCVLWAAFCPPGFFFYLFSFGQKHRAALSSGPRNKQTAARQLSCQKAQFAQSRLLGAARFSLFQLSAFARSLPFFSLPLAVGSISRAKDAALRLQY